MPGDTDMDVQPTPINDHSTPSQATPGAQEPWLTFPPWPEPKDPSVPIIPFSVFEAPGLYVRMDEEDISEVDPLGVTTVTLPVKHALTEEEQTRKKKKKRTVYRANGVIKRVLWFEEWEEGENFRRTIVNPLASRVDRLYAAYADFKSPAHRPWPGPQSSVPQLWDQFKLYIGLIGRIYPPPSKKKQQQMQEDEIDDDEIDDTGDGDNQEVAMVDDEAALRELHQKRREQEIEARRQNFTEEARARAERRGELKEQRMAYFFDDPELAIKEFFSAYYRDKGLIWDKIRCRDGPILVEFFLNYLLRSNVLPEYERGLRRAVEVAKMAKRELPLTFVVGEALPDAFSHGCEAVFGPMTSGMFTWEDADEAPVNDSTVADKTEGKTEQTEVATKAKTSQEELSDFVATNAHSDSVKAIDPDDPNLGLGAATNNTDGNGTQTEAISGWETSGWGDNATGNNTDAGWGTSNTGGGGWGDPNPLDPNINSDWLPPHQVFLGDILGPTVFHLTHTTGIIERSTRRILKVVPPPPPRLSKKKVKGKSAADLVEEELESRLGWMVLGPWKKVGNDVRSDIVAPAILPDSRGPTTQDDPASLPSSEANNSVHVHDTTKDEIVMLIEPKTVEKLQPAVGLGVLATWVQIARVDNEKGEEAETTEGKKTKKKGGPGVNGQPTKWWYMEQMMAALPSYHTDRYYPDQA